MEDVSITSKDFIQRYLEQYPERPMVRLSIGQTVKTECGEIVDQEGRWWR